MVQDTGLRELETLNTLLQIHSMDWLLASYSINSSLCSVHQKKKFTRLRSLLQLFSLEYRYVESIEDFERRKEELLCPIDYVHVNTVLQNEQERYRTFIQNSI